MLTPPKENFYRQKVWKTLTEIVRDFSFVIIVIGPINAFLDIFLDGFDPEFMQSNKGRRLSAIISALEYLIMAGLIIAEHSSGSKKAKNARHFVEHHVASSADLAASSAISLLSIAGTITLATAAVNNPDDINKPVDIPSGVALAICSIPIGAAVLYNIYLLRKHLSPTPSEEHSVLYKTLSSFSHHFEVASMVTAFLEFLERLNPNTNNALLVRFMIAKAALFGVVMSTTCIPKKIGNTITECAQSTAKALGVKNFMDKLNSEMFYAGIFVVAETVYFVYATPETLIIRSLATSAAAVAICTTNIVRTLKSSASEELTPLLTNAHKDPETPSPPSPK